MPQDIDLHQVLGALQQARTTLALETPHLCYLIALRAKADRDSLASLAEEVLIDVYLQVCEFIEPDAVNPRKRATHAIQHLSDQRLLRRVDGAGVMRAGEYTLTRLALAVVDFFVEDESLTKESLVILTRALTSQLAAIIIEARRATTPDGWHEQVAQPLRITVRDLVSGIERRQRGMDRQQEDIRERIGGLLQTDWFVAVADCEQLLEDTTATLRELNEVLLRDGAHLQALLQDIEQLARDAVADAAAAQCEHVLEQLERVTAWGSNRQRAWSDFYQYVQRFLRDVVRLDPDRAVSQRLRDQLAGWLDRPFSFRVTNEQGTRLLRDEVGAVERPPVTRAHRDHETNPELVQPDLAPVALEERVENALTEGTDGLAAVVAAVVPTLPDAEQYRAIGRVAELVSTRRRIHASLPRVWVELPDLGLTIEEWQLSPWSRR